jgi:ribosomal protein S18 acetylase RimI-like enzyme
MDTIQRILTIDPIWCAYAIADLQPAFAPYCEWYIGETEKNAHAPAVALLFTGLEIPTIFLTGPADGAAAALSRMPLPDQVYITVREEHFPEVSRHYDFSADTRPMWRMFLPPTTALTAVDAPGLTRLTAEDSDRLRRLYAYGGPFTPDAFSPYQVDNGVFFGVADGAGDLLAAGGTHIVDWTQGVGTIGNMYTRPNSRGRGYAAAVLAAIVGALRIGGVHNIVLNVDQRNEPARRIYEKYGFRIHCPYVEGIGVRRDA